MIKLNPLEIKIFQVFKNFLACKKIDVTLRVAGGWVRDKLLEKDSTDIDIALDKCSGERFAEMFHEYLIENEYESHGFGVIRKNPEKSKHLETATIQIFDCWIDFVNLRGEEYTSDSRIPLMKMGTPESDAFRRDFTINSLFYNINEEEVEDFTKMGLSDLKSGLMRTPLDPFKTFFDDPLRILRGFRFSVRFGFNLEDTIFKAIQKPEIRESFSKKISRERIGIEFMSNFENNPSLERAFGFFSLIHDVNYWPLILDTKNSEFLEKGYRNMCLLNQNILRLRSDFQYANEHWTTKDISKEVKDWEFMLFTFLAVFTIDYFDKKIKDHKKSFLFHTIVNSLKLPNRFAELACQIQKSYCQLVELAQNSESDLVDFAMWQRETGSIWKLNETIYNVLQPKTSDQTSKELELKKMLEVHGLSEFFTLKPLFDGKELGQMFDISGIQIKQKQTEVFRWQVRNSNKTKSDFLKEHKLH